MGRFIEIQWTAASIDEARKVARYLVQEKWVACAQIIPWIESIYLWDGALETGQETKVVFKSRDEFFDKIKEVIIKNSRYEIPEIISSDLKEINVEYREWLEGAILPVE